MIKDGRTFEASLNCPCKILKYPIEMKETFSIDMPAGAVIIEVGLHVGKPYMWCIADAMDEPLMLPRNCYLHTDSTPIDTERTLYYLGQFQMMDGSFVGHLFEDRT